MLPNPISPYAVAKLAGEHYLRCFTRVYGLETVVLRYFNVFGPLPGPHFALLRRAGHLLPPHALRRAGHHLWRREQSRDFTYIDNVVNANLLAAAAPAEKVSGRMMNLATGTRITLNEIFKILRELTGYQDQPTYAPTRAGDIRDSLADIRLAQELLGYKPTVDFREGLRRTVDWYRAGE
jgi:nucleoside-diphosphate-sugar epimerase